MDDGGEDDMSETDKTQSPDAPKVVPLRRGTRKTEPATNEPTAEDRANAFRVFRAHAAYVGDELFRLDTLILCAKEHQGRKRGRNERRVQVLLDMSFSFSSELQEKFSRLNEIYVNVLKEHYLGGDDGTLE